RGPAPGKGPEVLRPQRHGPARIHRGDAAPEGCHRHGREAAGHMRGAGSRKPAGNRQTGAGSERRLPFVARLMRIFPPDFRADFGAEMAEQVERDWARARGRGTLDVLWFNVAT